jgi:hypothetical protein
MSDYYEGAPATPKSSMAIISLVAGILGFTFFPLLGSIVAVITGPMAKKEIAESAGSLNGEGMAQAGLVLGWIGIALSVIGICVFVLIFALTFFGLAAFGLSSEESLIPLVFSVI